MKKLALTSLLAVFAVSGAHAANVIDGNPLYMPGQNHFYSVTSLGSHTENDTPWSLGEEFGYGIMDNLAINITTKATENKAFDDVEWDDVKFGVAFRALDKDGWKMDLVGAYGFDNLYNHPRPKSQDSWFDKDLTNYTWTAGVRGGYTTSDWTVAAKALFNYTNSESFNWNEDKGKMGVHTLTLGVDGQYVFDSNWSVLAGVEYTGYLDDEYKGKPGAKIENAGTWTATAGVNYNIDATKFVGAYVNGTMTHWKGEDAFAVTPASEKGWDFKDGFGFGAKFGIDF